MSEPMSSGEIEDVLSSIRRLVSEDLRPVPKGRSAEDPPAVTPAGRGASGKLLLTPALRVVAARDPDVPQRVTAHAPKLQPEVDDAAQAPFEEAEDAGDAAGADVEILHKDASGHPVPHLKREHDWAGNEDWLPEADAESDVAPVPGAAPKTGWAQAARPAGAVPDLTRVVSDIAAGVSGSEDDWEQETGDVPLSAAAMDGLSWHVPKWVDEAELVEDGAAVPKAGPKAKAGPETRIDAAKADLGATKAAADLAEAAAVAEIMARAAQAEADGPKGEADARDADTGYFDEAVLRDLVRDLIREELSGTLGERITRNMRKLVRAEVNRALTTREID